MRFTARRARLTVAVLTVVLAAAACSGSDGDQISTDTAPADTQVTPDAEPPDSEPPATDPPATEAPVATTADEPPPAEPPATDATDLPDIDFGDGFGPYEVGVQTITINDESGAGRNLTVDVWFPLRADLDTELAPQQYTLLPGVYYESPHAFAATPDQIATDGPFPLVVYSHGSGGLRYIHSDYTEAIASHGYIVAAPDHTGNTAVEDLTNTRDAPEAIALNRPRDVSAVINAMLNPESTETVGFVVNVDPDKIAVTGHSLGGFTSYAVATGYENDLGVYEPDTRVDALIVLAPAVGPSFTDEMLAAIQIPTLAMVGTDDVTTPLDPNVSRPWELMTNSPAYRVDLAAAEHQTFTDVCAYLDFLPTLPDVPAAVIDTITASGEQGCAPGDMPIERAQSITNTFATTFLDSVFRGTAPIALLEADEQPDLLYYVR